MVCVGVVGAVIRSPCADPFSDFNGLELEEEMSNLDLSDPGLSDNAECGDDGLCRSWGGVCGFGILIGVYPCGMAPSIAAAGYVGVCIGFDRCGIG